MRCFLPAVLIAACVTPLAAQSGYSPQRANPYKNLFQSKSLDEVAKTAAQPKTAVQPTQREKPRVVCGMTIIPAPNVDPKMMVEPRTDSTRYTIRAIEPPICWSPDPK
jgi:hypothetical protein